ncbi:MAG: acetolactate synthase small subunit [Saprospiraceae bacterium]|nr:acetolactate synthase small subunit [Bacteroidia bacterium]NNE16578.1 acetolactate synthase small subunit [Saprospiraceae bacterium]NNL92590.1 acetolactate synthase small subunit [Saprospiraceae bacterium]
MEKEFTITVFTENKLGLLQRVVAIITKRHINIESIAASESSMKGIHRFTLVLNLTDEQVRKLTLQIEKQVDVLKAFYYETSEIVYQEIALYKVATQSFFQSDDTEELLRRHNARILSIEPEYIVIEKTGHKEETNALLEELRIIGIYEFARSGRVAIVKPMERLNNHLKSVDKKRNHKKLESNNI